MHSLLQTDASPYHLAAMLDTVAPRIDPALVCRENFDRIMRVARAMPHWQCAGFECRLGDPAPRADFGVHLRRKHGIGIHPTPESGGAENDPTTGDVWRRLGRFSAMWSNRRSAVSHAIPAVSLEFDLHLPEGSLAPSVFFSVHPRRVAPGQPTPEQAAAECAAVVREALDALEVSMAPAAERLDECFRVLLHKVPYLQLGVWLARPVSTFRVCAPGLRLPEVDGVMRALRGCGAGDAFASYEKDLLQFTRRVALHIDVGRDVSPRLGDEVGFGETSVGFQRDDPDDTRFFDYLVDRDLCLPAKRDALFLWVGGHRLGQRGAGTGLDQPFFMRTISHVKLVFAPDRDAEAKVYLALGRIERLTEH